MRSILPALAVGLFATAAQADGVDVVTCSAPYEGGTNECSFDLVKGQDYAIVAGEDDTYVGFGDQSAELINPAGTVTITLDGGGTQFRAAYSATYRLRITDGEALGYYARIATDCRGDAKAACKLPPGKTATGAGAYESDPDWYQSDLRKGRTYTFSMTSNAHAEVALLDNSGRQLPKAHYANGKPAVIKYKAKYVGPYYLVETLSHGPYTVNVK